MRETPEFSDWLAICNLKAAYCRLLDTKDWAAFKTLFTPDCVVDTRPAGGGVEHGRDAFVAMVSKSLASAKTVHHIHSPEITVNGDEAHVIWAMQDRVVSEAFAMTGYGHYHETLTRTFDGWKIAKQTLTRLMVDMAQQSGAGASLHAQAAN